MLVRIQSSALMIAEACAQIAVSAVYQLWLLFAEKPSKTCAVMATYIRFETPFREDKYREPLGIFRAVPMLEERVDLSTHSQDLLQQSLAWFNSCLPVPSSNDVDSRAIFWYRGQSQAVRETWQLVAILREEGVRIRLRKTKMPGRIVYRDDFQIAAIPFGHGLRRRSRNCRRSI
jgi:hypothetical protein